MRLLNPSPGELADRQSILELKLDYSMSEMGKSDTLETVQGGVRSVSRTVVTAPTKVNIIPFKQELEAIVEYNRRKWAPGIAENDEKVAEYDRLYEELSEVNGDLWKLEDQARTILKRIPEGLEGPVNARLGEIYELVIQKNDRRAELVKKINALWNIDHQEKIYS